VTDPRGRGARPNPRLLKCPNCGAPNHYDGQGKTQICSYCDAKIAVPSELLSSAAPPPVTPIPRPAHGLGYSVAG
jgi:hypothetical protein